MTLEMARPRGVFRVERSGPDRWWLVGELDMAAVPVLVSHAATWSEAPTLYLECGLITFIDVAGWQGLREIRQLLQPDRDVRLCHVSPPLARIIRVLGHP